MHLHEYQAKEILNRFGIASTRFEVASTLTEVEEAIEKLQSDTLVVKAQIHAGGRGKGGGVKLVQGREEILRFARQLLFQKLVTPQTGAEGLLVSKILLTPPVQIKREFYVAILSNWKAAHPELLISARGGVEIEEVAAKEPQSLHTESIRLDGHLYSFQLLAAAKFLGWTGELAKKGGDMLAKLARSFVAIDASLLEINPLVETQQGELVALDAKITLDDNALFRQEAALLYDASQVSVNEALAKQWDLAYVGLDGEIGCLVNGAGLAMATMDLIAHFGGRPANFLDVGGSATKEKIAHGFKIILSDRNVKTIFVNIFGGIMNCGLLAEGIIYATKEVALKVPLVIRMEGTHVERGKELLAQSGLKIVLVDTMEEGAKQAVEESRGHSR